MFAEIDAEVVEWLRRCYPCGRRVSAGTIAARIGHPRPAILRSLLRLEAAGILSGKRLGRSKFAGLAVPLDAGK